MISIASLDILSDVSVLVLWPYNRLPQSSYVWDVWSLEVCVDLGQIAKLSPGTLVWCTELGLSDLLPTFVFWVYSYFFWAQGISGCSISVWRELCWCLPSVLLLLFLFLESPRSFFRFCLLGGVFLLELDPGFVCYFSWKVLLFGLALCRFCLCVEYQSPGCTVCCQVPPNVLPSTFKSVSRSYFCVLDRPNFQ